MRYLTLSYVPEDDISKYLSVPDESLAALADEFDRTGQPVRNERIAAFLMACGVDPADTRRGADVAREMIQWFALLGLEKALADRRAAITKSA